METKGREGLMFTCLASTAEFTHPWMEQLSGTRWPVGWTTAEVGGTRGVVMVVEEWKGRRTDELAHGENDITREDP